MLGGRRDEWLAARLEDLGYGDINGIEAAVREYPLEGIRKDEAGKELGYIAGADAIIALRCKEASSQREAICNHRHNQTGAA